ncbi:hypothetical protein [Flavobacterium sp. UMI-01]|uniref:hypothetical protein n=1 Tax=Flavobacterium sp. UMI-01 TaxID=1441053 RepID=UPI001C7D313C|nr:hypothetical protein [Flavobacterium sp. UMI-01]GIZ08395.1 hypothetical protein FUMI01_11220 [Flavobacterium sp. UMI-01]
MSKFEYRGFYQKYDMSEVIKIGTGIIKVHDIFDDLPGFMFEADCLFIDPPCNEGNLKSFYTKADLEKRKSIIAFNERLFELIDKIQPKHLFIESFASNKKNILEKLSTRYFVKEFTSYYYGSEKNKCYIFYATVVANDFELPYVDEEKAIEYICQNLDFNCIGDLCMGKGLVGFYANKYGKKFVGTELNKKRLACLIEHINQNKIIVR